MRLASKCTDCGFENPRTWVTCARCGCLLGPRLWRSAETGTGAGTGQTEVTRRAALAPPPDAAVVAPDLGPDEKTNVYGPGALAPEPPPPAEPAAAEPPASPGQADVAAPPQPSEPVRAAHPDARPLLGQTAALEQLKRALEAALRGTRAALLLLQGEPGSGRTLMLHRASELGAGLSPDVAVHYAALRSRDDGPYAPFSRLLLDRFGITPASSPVAVRGAMELVVAEALGASARVAETTHLLGHVAGVPFPDSTLLRELERDPDSLREQAIAAVARFAAGEIGRRPALLLLDDFTDADDPALELLGALLELPGPLALVATGRPPLAERAATLKARAPERVFVADLQPLAATEAAEVVRALVPGLKELPAELLSALMHRSSGNPRQLVEIVRALLDGGLFKHTEDGMFVDLARLELGGLPVSMADAIRARLATLDAAELQVMRDAAVVGEHFWDGALLTLRRAREPLPDSAAPALEVFSQTNDEHALESALESLERKGFILQIVEASAPGTREYTFEYAGTRTLLYADCPEAERQKSHALVARWLSLTPALSVESMAALLAPHLEHAGAREQAARAYLKAGGDEHARMRTTMALRYADKALALTDAADTATRIEALHERGSLLTTLGRYAEALHAFEEIVRLAWALGARGRGGAALNRIARIHRERAEHDQALAHLRMALVLFGAIGDDRGVASSYDDMAQIHRMRGELGAALSAAKAGLQIRVQAEDRRGQAVSLNTMGRIELDQGLFDSAQARFATALKIRESLADHEGAVQTRIALGQLAFRRGRTDEATRIYLAALEAAREMNNRRFQSYTLSFLGEAYVAQNELERADAALREAKRLATGLRDQNALATIERTMSLLAQRRSPA